MKNKEGYIGDTIEKTCGSDDSTSETDGYVKNMGKYHKNQEYEEYSETTTEINYMSWIICFNNKMKYEIDKSNHQYWLNKGTW